MYQGVVSFLKILNLTLPSQNGPGQSIYIDFFLTIVHLKR
jgi:hypothetical protein